MVVARGLRGGLGVLVDGGFHCQQVADKRALFATPFPVSNIASRPTRSPLQQSIRAPPTSSKENVTSIAKSWTSESPELRMNRSRGHAPNQLRSLQMPLEPLKSYKMPRWCRSRCWAPWFSEPCARCRVTVGGVPYNGNRFEFRLRLTLNP